MRVLIVGYGSIGARHARLLSEQGHDVHAVTANPECKLPSYPSLAEAIERFAPQAVVVSNATGDHFSTLNTLSTLDYLGNILIEKPLFERYRSFSSKNTSPIHVAYNMRYHPIIKRTKELLNDKDIYSAQFHVGQYLPDWRPGTDYRQSYSADRTRGGGVLRDLSHELDTALWLLGPWKRATALGGQFSQLEIDSDDVFTVLMETERCPAATVHMDYLNRQVRRGFDINAEGISLRADFVKSTLEINGQPESFTMERDTMYADQIKAFTEKNFDAQCSLEEGLAVLQLIDALETSVRERSWMEAE